MFLSSFKNPDARRHIVIGLISIALASVLLPSLPTTQWQAGLRSPFSDTDPSTLKGHAAIYLFHRGIISGFPDSTFRGHLPVSRAEAAKMLLLAANFPPLDNLPSPFRDILGNEWFAPHILTATERNILQGYPDGSFRPERNVSAAEFLKMSTRTFNLVEKLPHHFTDVKDSDWFAPFAGVARHYHLFPERIDSSLLIPNHWISRDDTAFALFQILTFGSKAHFNKPEWKWIPKRGSPLINIPKPTIAVSSASSLPPPPVESSASSSAPESSASTSSSINSSVISSLSSSSSAVSASSSSSATSSVSSAP